AGIAQLAESLPQVCLATLSASRGTQLSATRHSQVILDYEATVANSIAATNPEFGTITEGFLLRGAITPMHEQMVLLDVNLTILQRDAARPVFDLKHRAIGPIDKIRIQENKVRGSSPVELDNWTILHLAPLPSGQQHVAVAVRVHAL